VRHRIVGGGSVTTRARDRGAVMTMYFQHLPLNVVTTMVRQITRNLRRFLCNLDVAFRTKWIDRPVGIGDITGA
jgi:hypothetical protein